MKRQLLLSVAFAVFAAALATNASAQTTKTLRANVKFDFQIGDRTYPAGEYRISLQSDDILLIRSIGDADKTQFIVANHSNAGKGQTPKVIFQKCGESYFLTQVFLDYAEWGYAIPPARRQRESERHLASRVPRNN